MIKSIILKETVKIEMLKTAKLKKNGNKKEKTLQQARPCNYKNSQVHKKKAKY